MLPRLIALASLLLALAPAAAVAAPCPIATLPDDTLASGDEAVERYRELRRLQFDPDLMGYRDGPALGPPTMQERRAIRPALRFRRDFGLNRSRLLVRRLLRDRSPAVRRSAGEWGTPLTALERRDLAFRTRVQNATYPVRRYVDRCAREVNGGTHLDQSAPQGIRVVVSVVADRQRHLEALRARYRLRGLLRVRSVRFTERQLRSLMDRITADLDELDRTGVEVRSVSLYIARNRVEVTLDDPSSRARRLLRRRYGPALRVAVLRSH